VTSRDHFGARDGLGLAEACATGRPPLRHHAPQAGDPRRPGHCAGPAAPQLAKKKNRERGIHEVDKLASAPPTLTDTDTVTDPGTW
jgi:hypothetical protein